MKTFILIFIFFINSSRIGKGDLVIINSVKLQDSKNNMIPLVGIELTTVYSQTVCMVRYILYIYLLFLMVKFNAKDHFVSGNICVGVTEQQNTQKKPF